MHVGWTANSSDMFGYVDPGEDIHCASIVADLVSTATDRVKGAEECMTKSTEARCTCDMLTTSPTNKSDCEGCELTESSDEAE